MDIADLLPLNIFHSEGLIEEISNAFLDPQTCKVDEYSSDNHPFFMRLCMWHCWRYFQFDSTCTVERRL